MSTDDKPAPIIPDFFLAHVPHMVASASAMIHNAYEAKRSALAASSLKDDYDWILADSERRSKRFPADILVAYPKALSQVPPTEK